MELWSGVDQDLVEERDMPIHYFSVLIHVLYVCIHIVCKAKTGQAKWYSLDTAGSAHCVIVITIRQRVHATTYLWYV